MKLRLDQRDHTVHGLQHRLEPFQNFIIMPTTFFSGVFCSVHSLPPFWLGLSHANPFFYMIDGFRRGLFGASDVSPWLSPAVVGTSFAVVAAIALRLLATGYKLRSLRRAVRVDRSTATPRRS